MKLKPLKIAGELEIVSYEAIVNDEDQIFEGIEINDAEFLDTDLGRLISYNSVIKNSNLSNNEFDNADLTDTRFVNCDFSNTVFSGASVHNVEFVNCKMIGVSFDESRIKNVKFSESLLNLSGISESKLENVLFENARMVTADFFNNKFKNIDFDNCDLSEARFVDTPLKCIDISSSHFESLSIKREDLEGCIVSSVQAIQMAALMGLVVKDD